MKILQLNWNYNEGSTGKIVECIGDVLRAQGHGVLTCYGYGKDYYDNHSIKVCTPLEHKFNAVIGRITGIPFGGPYISNYRIIKVIESFKPDVVHVHCVNGYTLNVYKLLSYLGKANIKTVVTLHAEIYHTAGCSHAYECEQWKTKCVKCPQFRNGKTSGVYDTTAISWQKMYDAINSFRPENLIITAVSPWLEERAKQSSILRRFKTVYVPNGLDTDVFYHRENKGLIERNQYQKVVLFVTPYFSHDELDLKGGRFLPVIAESLPDYKFIVVASQTASNLKLMPDNVCLWGKANGQNELAQLYSEADVTLLLSKRETFSMVTAESLCCGTPVVGFMAGGPESIAMEEYSRFVEYGDLEAVSAEIENLCSKEFYRTDISNQSNEKYSKETMSSVFFSIYADLVNIQIK